MLIRATQFILLVLVFEFATAIWAPVPIVGRESEPVRAIAESTAPVLSHNGKFAAYTVTVPDTRERLAGTRQSRYLDDGTPNRLRGSRLLVSRLGSGGGEPISISAGDSWDPAWSPDDEQVAFFSSEKGTVQLWLYDLRSRTKRQISQARVYAKYWNGDGPCWSRDGRRIYVPIVTKTFPGTGSSSEGVEEDPKVAASAIASMDVRTGESTMLPPAAAVNFLRRNSLSPSGHWLATVTFDYLLSVIDLESGNLQTIGHIDALIVDRMLGAGSDNYAGPYWEPQRDRLAYLAGGRLYIKDFSDGKTVELATNLHGLHWTRNNALAYTLDGKSLVNMMIVGDQMDLLVAPTDGGPARLFPVLSDLHAQDIDSEYTRGAAVLRLGPNLLWQPDSTHVFFVHLDPSTAELVVQGVNIQTGGSQEVARMHASIEIVGQGGGGGNVVALYEDFNTARNLFTVSPAFKLSEPLTLVATASRLPATFAVFTTQVPDYEGAMRTVRAAVILPSGKPAGGPALVCIYPGAKNSTGVNEFAIGNRCEVPVSGLMERGYTVILPDLIVLPINSHGHYERIRAKDVTDSLLPQVYRAANSGYVDINRVAVLGHSQGALAALQAVCETNLFRAAVGLSGVRYAPYAPDQGWPAREHQLIDAEVFSEGLSILIMNSPYYRANQIQASVLLAHGEADTYPALASEIMANALRRTGKVVEYDAYPGEGHDLNQWSATDFSDLLNHVMRFLDANVGRSRPRDQ